jgi:hypothetical protein
LEYRSANALVDQKAIHPKPPFSGFWMDFWFQSMSAYRKCGPPSNHLKKGLQTDYMAAYWPGISFFCSVLKTPAH